MVSRCLRPKYIAQTKARPPTFVVFSSQGTELPEDYRRYLVNGLRDDFGFLGVPVRLLVRRGKDRHLHRRSPHPLHPRSSPRGLGRPQQESVKEAG